MTEVVRMTEGVAGMTEGVAGMTEGDAGMAEGGVGMTKGGAGMTEGGAGMTKGVAGMTEGVAGWGWNWTQRGRGDRPVAPTERLKEKGKMDSRLRGNDGGGENDGGGCGNNERGSGNDGYAKVCKMGEGVRWGRGLCEGLLKGEGEEEEGVIVWGLPRGLPRVCGGGRR